MDGHDEQDRDLSLSLILFILPIHVNSLLLNFARGAADDFDREVDVTTCRAVVGDRGAEGEAAAEERVRDVGLAAALDAVHDALVQAVEPRVGLVPLPFIFESASEVGGHVAEAADAERDRREQLEVLRGADAFGHV